MSTTDIHTEYGQWRKKAEEFVLTNNPPSLAHRSHRLIIKKFNNNRFAVEVQIECSHRCIITAMASRRLFDIRSLCHWIIKFRDLDGCWIWWHQIDSLRSGQLWPQNYTHALALSRKAFSGQHLYASNIHTRTHAHTHTYTQRRLKAGTTFCLACDNDQRAQATLRPLSHSNHNWKR